MQKVKDNYLDFRERQEKLKEPLENYRREIFTMKELMNRLENFGLVPMKEKVNDIFVNIRKKLFAMEIYGSDDVRNKISAFDSPLEKRVDVIYNQIGMFIEKTKGLEGLYRVNNTI
ncbi:MAG TPA: hypothetical protein EYG91_04765 [Aquifex aeolicus]|nr:hypothetical protein [Aquifex aeolicus]